MSWLHSLAFSSDLDNIVTDVLIKFILVMHACIQIILTSTPLPLFVAKNKYLVHNIKNKIIVSDSAWNLLRINRGWELFKFPAGHKCLTV